MIAERLRIRRIATYCELMTVINSNRQENEISLLKRDFEIRLKNLCRDKDPALSIKRTEISTMGASVWTDWIHVTYLIRRKGAILGFIPKHDPVLAVFKPYPGSSHLDGYSEKVDFPINSAERTNAKTFIYDKNYSDLALKIENLLDEIWKKAANIH
ncbi:MAG: hypothetical protein KGH54_02880 [Candidatus Micrarchaeota archaeon]|nr:hypothetical protein [Candidatus Micrarchaeota archaeon]